MRLHRYQTAVGMLITLVIDEVTSLSGNIPLPVAWNGGGNSCFLSRNIPLPVALKSGGNSRYFSGNIPLSVTLKS